MNTTIQSDRRDFRIGFFRMLLVIALQNVIVYGVSLLDNIMLGGYTELALSGVALVNQVQFLLQMLIGGVSDGIIVIASRFWGEKNPENIKKTANIAMRVALGIGAVMFLFAFFAPHSVLGILTDKEHVIAEGVKYMRIICFSYFFFAGTQVLLGMLRSAETAFVGFINSLAALVCNGILNYGLIYGNFGMPEMGVRGAAIATLISRILEFLIVVVYLAFFDRKLHVRLKDFITLHIDMEIFRKFIKVSLPVVLSGGSWGIAQAMQTAILGRLDESVISANSIATTVFSIMSVVVYGAATATSVMIGKTLGQWKTENRPEAERMAEIKHRARWLQVVYLIIGSATGIALFIMKDIIIDAYNISDETRTLAILFMTVLSVTVVGTAYQMTSLTGIVRGGGDTKFVLFNDIIFMWGIVLPSSFIAAFVLELEPLFIFMCLKSDQILKCFVAVVKVNRFKWIKKI
ncbi:MAG: MATE family efflux transporter [Clostridia bacterium]|nr:MATE family efflux transporter [Clostridia bacterium]